MGPIAHRVLPHPRILRSAPCLHPQTVPRCHRKKAPSRSSPLDGESARHANDLARLPRRFRCAPFHLHCEGASHVSRFHRRPQKNSRSAPRSTGTWMAQRRFPIWWSGRHWSCRSIRPDANAACCADAADRRSGAGPVSRESIGFDRGRLAWWRRMARGRVHPHHRSRAPRPRPPHRRQATQKRQSRPARASKCPRRRHNPAPLRRPSSAAVSRPSRAWRQTGDMEGRCVVCAGGEEI